VAKLRITYNAPVVLTFAIAAVAVFLLNSSMQSTRLWFVAWPELHDGRSYVGLFTHILGHANWQHPISNFMLILLLGPTLEERHGSSSLLVIIPIPALITGLRNLPFRAGPPPGAGRTGVMEDATEVRWDIRPAPRWGLLRPADRASARRGLGRSCRPRC